MLTWPVPFTTVRAVTRTLLAPSRTVSAESTPHPTLSLPSLLSIVARVSMTVESSKLPTLSADAPPSSGTRNVRSSRCQSLPVAAKFTTATPQHWYRTWFPTGTLSTSALSKLTGWYDMVVSLPIDHAAPTMEPRHSPFKEVLTSQSRRVRR